MTATVQSSPQSVLSQFGLAGLWNPNDTLMSLYTQIAASYKTNKTPSGFTDLAIACMMARMYLYYKRAPGDCGIPTSVSSNPSLQLAQSAIATAGTLGGPLGVAAATPVEAILSIFGQHHKQAVATEQFTACDVAGKVNGAFQTLDSYVASGQMSLSQVLSTIENIRSTAIAEFRPILKDCNTACVGTRVINCLCDLRKQIYATTGGSSTTSLQAAGSSLSKTNNLTIAALVALAGGVAIKVAGVL